MRCFLRYFQAFVKAWHQGLIFKLKQNGISGKLLNLIKDFLKNKKQRVAGVPQGSILESLLFLMYINNLTNYLSSRAKLFADDNSLFFVVFHVDVSAKEFNHNLTKVQDWALKWKMSFNPEISIQARAVIFSRKLKKLHILH